MGVLMGTQIGFGRNAERGGASLGFSGLKVLAAWAAGLGFVKLVSACTQTARLGRLWGRTRRLLGSGARHGVGVELVGDEVDIARAIVPASVSEGRCLGFDERWAAAVSRPPHGLVAAPRRVRWLGVLVEVVDRHGVPATVPAGGEGA